MWGHLAGFMLGSAIGPFFFIALEEQTVDLLLFSVASPRAIDSADIVDVAAAMVSQHSLIIATSPQTIGCMSHYINQLPQSNSTYLIGNALCTRNLKLRNIGVL